MRINYLSRTMMAAAFTAALLGGCGSSPAGSTGAETQVEAESTSQAGSEMAASDEERENDDATVPESEEKQPDGSGMAPDDVPEMPEGAGGHDGPGGPGGPGGGPGSGSVSPESYDAAVRYDSDTETVGQTYMSAGKDENAVLVQDGTVSIDGAEISRTSEDSAGGDRASFYGVGAAALCTGGTLKISGSTITTDAAGGTGAFAYGDGVVYISDSSIHSSKDTSGGIHAAGGGTLYADNVTTVTEGQSSAAIRSDRGGGTMVVTGGSYTSNGVGSPAVYCTADIMVSNADLAAAGSEAVCIEGRNSLKLTDCNLSGSMADDMEQNDTTWTVIVYQSMSGDSEVGCGSFSMTGGTLTSANGGLFYTTNTESEIKLQNVRISAAKDCEFLLQCTGNRNARGWGQTGGNGARCTFTANNQTLEGNVIWDSISTLDMHLSESSALVGVFVKDDSWSGVTEAAEEEIPAAEDASAGEQVSADNTETAEETTSAESAGEPDETDRAEEGPAEDPEETAPPETDETAESAAEPASADAEEYTSDTNGHAALYIDASSVWVVTADTALTRLENKGLITDPQGRIINIIGTDGTVYVEGDSSYTVTVGSYSR